MSQASLISQFAGLTGLTGLTSLFFPHITANILCTDTVLHLKIVEGAELTTQRVTQAILHPFTVLIIINYCGGRSAEKTVHYIAVINVSAGGKLLCFNNFVNTLLYLMTIS